MPTATKPLPARPDQSHPLVDPRTGAIDQRWDEYLTALDRLLRALRQEIP